MDSRLYFLIMSCLVPPHSSKALWNLASLTKDMNITDPCAPLNVPLELTCRPGETVAAMVLVAFNDKAAVSQCAVDDDDCFDESMWLIFKITSCVWREDSCRFTLNSFDSPRGRVCDGSLKPQYLIAREFACVPDENIHRICLTETTELVAESETTSVKYLLTPSFMNSYVPNSQTRYNHTLCSVQIQAPPGHGIKIRSIYMDLHKDDYVTLSMYNRKVAGESIAIRKNFTDLKEDSIPYDTVQLTFNIMLPKDSFAHQGFAWRYSEYNVTSTSVNISSLTPGETTQSIPSPETSAYHFTPASVASDVEFPRYYIWWIAALGVLLIMVLITLMVILIKRRRNKCRAENIQGTDVKDPARFPPGCVTDGKKDDVITVAEGHC